MFEKRLTKSRPWAVSSVLVFLVIALWSFVQPASCEQVPLPPRETPTPVPRDGDGNGGPVGAFIQLNVEPAKAGLWAVVQWQDSAGAWHQVDGWSGPVGSTGSAYWWVAPKDFGTGPFRWHITAMNGGAALGDSAPFSLPNNSAQTTQVVVLLP